MGLRNRLERVRILGPLQSADQIEISCTDEFFLGIDSPVRESGKVDNTPGCKLLGPVGEADIEDAGLFGVGAGPRRRRRNVLIRVSPSYKLEMHIDTDEGNAAEIRSGDEGVLSVTTSEGTLRRRRVTV